jgi:hypothetical protein
VPEAPVRVVPVVELLAVAPAAEALVPHPQARPEPEWVAWLAQERQASGAASVELLRPASAVPQQVPVSPEATVQAQ